MKKFWILLLAFLPILTQARTGLGIIIGEPTGLSLKVWKGSTALDAALAYDFEDNHEKLHLHSDFLFQFKDPLGTGIPNFWFYTGIGPTLNFPHEDDFSLGARIPLGMEGFPHERINLFLEVVPVLQLVESTDFDLEAGVGIRFVF